jgi:Ras-related protein Rab-11A
MAEKKDYNYLYKLLVLGASFVGKTNMLKRFLHNEFDSNSKETVGVEFGSKNFMFGEKDDIVKAQIWDTAGQERYRSVTKAYYKGAKGALLVYDITRKPTFENIDNWLIDLRTNADKDILIILIGNKSDLQDLRDVSKEEGLSKAEQYNIAFLETSAKSGDNINNAFNQLVEQVYKANISKVQNNDQIEERNDDGINLVNKDEEETTKKGCC